MRSLKPIAVNLAKTSLLFQGMELNVTNDTYRWAPPKPVTITPNSPASYDPSTKLTIEHRWAVRWVRDFMTLLHERRTESTTHSTELNDVGNGVLAFGMMLEFRSHSTVHLIGDTSAYSCDMVMLEPSSARDGIEDIDIEGCQQQQHQRWLVPERLMFEPIISTVAAVYDDVASSRKNNGPGVLMNFVTLKIASTPNTNMQGPFRLTYVIVENHFVCKLGLRRSYQREEKAKPEQGLDTGGKQQLDAGSPSVPTDESNCATADDDISDELDDDFVNAMHQEMQNELSGQVDSESLADQFVDELQHDEQFEDLKTMDDINAKFVATVVERQHADTLGQFDVASPTGGADDDATKCDRTFEDEFGEDLLQDFMRNRLSSSEPKDATNQTEHSSSSTSTQSRNTMLSESQIDYALTNWKRGLEKSLEACVAMANHLRSFETSRVEATLSHDVSLLIHDKSTEDSVDVSYVSWLKPFKNVTGRIISLDDTSSIIYPSHFHATKLNLTGAIVIVPCVGARVRKQEREQISADVRRLHQMFTSALTTTEDELGMNDPDTDVGEGQLLCAGCRRADSTAVNRCSLCLCYWHDRCSQQISRYVNSFKVTHGVQTLDDVELSLPELPFILLPDPRFSVTVSNRQRITRIVFIHWLCTHYDG